MGVVSSSIYCLPQDNYTLYSTLFSAPLRAPAVLGIQPHHMQVISNGGTSPVFLCLDYDL